LVPIREQLIFRCLTWHLLADRNDDKSIDFKEFVVGTPPSTCALSDTVTLLTELTEAVSMVSDADKTAVMPH
jgi:hypothetical protein